MNIKNKSGKIKSNDNIDIRKRGVETDRVRDREKR